MRYYLENDILKAEFDSFGGELKSVLRKDGYREYMWYGNGKFWARTSPVLFPVVGNVKGGAYDWKDKSYRIHSHGFARDMEHTLISQDEDEIWFELKSSQETMEAYPFPFVLNCGYRLSGDELHVMWKVTNPSREILYFSLGGHPAFLCPVNGEGSKEGYRLAFEKEGRPLEEIRHHGNITGAGLALHEDLSLPLIDGRAEISREFFDRCTYMIEGGQADRVSLETPGGERIVQLDFDTPLFAIWSPEKKNAPFLCIEPWFGRTDYEDFEGSFSERDYTQALEAGGVFDASYTIKYF